MKLQIDIAKLKSGLKNKKEINSVIEDSNDLKVLLETLFAEDDFILDCVNVNIISYDGNRAVVSLSSDESQQKERILCAAELIGTLSDP